MMYKKLFSMLLVVLFFTPVVACAQDAIFQIDTNSISDLEIEEHFSNIDKLMTSPNPNIKLVYEYADRYLADNFAMKQRVKTNNAQDLGDIEETLVTRDAVLEQFQDERKILHNSSLKHRILDIEHNKDNNTAKVTYSSLFKGHIKAQNKDGVFYSQEFIQFSKCYDLLKMEDGHIKSFRAECDMEVIQKEPVKL